MRQGWDAIELENEIKALIEKAPKFFKDMYPELKEAGVEVSVHVRGGADLHLAW